MSSEGCSGWGLGVTLSVGVGVPGGAARLMAGRGAGERLPSRCSPPTPVATAVTAATPPTVMNLRRSMVFVIVSSCGCPRDQVHCDQVHCDQVHCDQVHCERVDTVRPARTPAAATAAPPGAGRGAREALRPPAPPFLRTE